jgi:hypothetical protein
MMRRQSCIHTLLQLLILVALPLGVSQAQPEPHLITTPYVWSVRTVTTEGRVRVTITKPKQKLHLARHQRPLVRLSLTDDDSDYYDERPEFQIGYRRPELVDQSAEVHDDISDEIKIRLLLARKRALEAYHSTWR